MAIRYYRKFSPKVPIAVALGGQTIRIDFDTVDGVLGWYATENEGVQAEFSRMMREQRGGITEVSAEEFTSGYVEKKNQPSPQPSNWREELSRSQSRQGQDPVGRLGSASLAAALRVNGSADVRHNNKAGLLPEPSAPTSMGSSTQVPEEQPKETFIPAVGKRKPPGSKK